MAAKEAAVQQQAMSPEGRAALCSGIVEGDVCAVCRSPISPDGFWHTCGWLFCSEKCSAVGSDDAIRHQARIAAAIREAVADEREACAKIADRMEGAGEPGHTPGLMKYSPIGCAIRNR